MTEYVVGFYEYTSCETKKVVLDTGTYSFEAWGAEGGYSTSSAPGGRGGYAKGEITLGSKTTLFIHLGERGKNSPNIGGIYAESSCNGGGKGYHCAGGGGGGCDVRVLEDDLNHRILVSGGGGGGNDQTGDDGGFGGGMNGGNGNNKGGTAGKAGKGGNQETETTTCSNGAISSNCQKGTFGYGGNATGNFNYQAGGGGGWFGGSTSFEYGAGGGSGYALTNSSFKPNGYFREHPNYYFRNVVLLGGDKPIPIPSSSLSSTNANTENGHPGNSCFKITRLSPIRTNQQTPMRTMIQTPFEYPKNEEFHFEFNHGLETFPLYDTGGEFHFVLYGNYNSLIPKGHYLLSANTSKCGYSVLSSFIVTSKVNHMNISINEDIKIHINSNLLMMIPGGTGNSLLDFDDNRVEFKRKILMKEFNCQPSTMNFYSQMILIFQKDKDPKHLQFCNKNSHSFLIISLLAFFAN